MELYKDIISYLQFLVNESDTVAFERIVNVPRRGIGESTVKKIRTYLNETGKSIFDALENIEEIQNISPRIKGSLSDFKDLITELKSYSLQGPSKTIEKVLELTGYKMSLIKEGTLESQMRIENIEELLNSAFNFCINKAETSSCLIPETILCSRVCEYGPCPISCKRIAIKTPLASSSVIS